MASLEEYSDFALYEIFYEAGTELGGTLTALEIAMQKNKNQKRYESLLQEHLQINRDRFQVNNKDRNTQIRFIKRWTARREELEKELDSIA